MYGFDEIYGNDLIKGYLKRAAKEKTASHAYIISGSEGCGKTLMANAFAKALQCEDGSGEACNRCISCRIFDSANHPDVLYVAPTKTKAIGVDDIREQVCAPMEEKPFKYRYKIFVIENGDTMTPAAQNALLKALEEPADYGVFLITATNPEKFLTTVLSRTILMKIKPLPDKLVYDYLTNKAELTEKDALDCYAYAAGSIGRALKLLGDEGFTELRSLAETIVIKEYSTYAEIFGAAKELENHKSRINELLNILYLLYRDIIVYKACSDEKYITWKHNIGFVKATAKANRMETLYNKLEAVLDTMDIISKNANYTISMDVLMLELGKTPACL